MPDTLSTGTWAANGGVIAAYDKLFRWALKDKAVLLPFIDVEPEDVTSAGSSYTIQKQRYFAEADILAAQTPLTDGTDVTPTEFPRTDSVVITPTEYGLAVVRTEKLDRRGLVPVKPLIGRAVGVHAADTLDWRLQTEMRTGTNVFRAQGRATTATVTATDYLRATELRKAVTKLRTGQAEARDGQFYAGFLHPNVIHDLREETGTGGWRVPNEYGSSQNRIWNGEFGEFEGVRWVSTTTMKRATDNDGAAAAVVYRGFVMGREALAKAQPGPTTVVVSPQVDLLRRKFGVGWKADVGYEIFREEAIVRLESAASVS